MASMPKLAFLYLDLLMRVIDGAYLYVYIYMRKRLLLSAFPMFVPSLSWQRLGFYHKMAAFLL